LGVGAIETPPHHVVELHRIRDDEGVRFPGGLDIGAGDDGEFSPTDPLKMADTFMCPKCGTENRATANRCLQCGQDLFNLPSAVEIATSKSEVEYLSLITTELQRHSKALDANERSLRTIKNILLFWLALSILVALLYLLATAMH
jgi:hypothetical protein